MLGSEVRVLDPQLNLIASGGTQMFKSLVVLIVAILCVAGAVAFWQWAGIDPVGEGKESVSELIEQVN